MSLRVASAELISILFMLIILGSTIHRGKRKTFGHYSFEALIITTTLGLGFDALSYILEESFISSGLLTLFNILAFAMVDLCIVSFSFYMLSLIRLKKNISFTYSDPGGFAF